MLYKINTSYKIRLEHYKSYKNPNLQTKDQIALNWINDIAQYTSDIRYLPAKANAVSDFLSRPADCPLGTAYLPPSYELAAIESFLEDSLSPTQIQEFQNQCPSINNHRKFNTSSNFKDIEISPGIKLYCELSASKPRPIIPTQYRPLLIKKLHCFPQH